MTKVVIEKECPVPFSSLVKGDVFLHSEFTNTDTAYIKTETMFDSGFHDAYNCINLYNGKMDMFQEDEKVIFCNELVVK